ncbi:hypothetical protein [Xenorhabdus taiwanensis]
MSYFPMQVIAFLIFGVTFLSSLSVFILMKKNFLKVIFCGMVLVASGFFAIKSFSGMFGDNYENDTKLYLTAVFASNHSSDSDFLSSIREVRKNAGFESTDIYVNSVWNGIYYFDGRKIPLNIYEINIKWKNEKKDVVEHDCFMFSYANDWENDYMREIKFYNDCSKKDNFISKIKGNINKLL